MEDASLKDSLVSGALAFRGYNTTNLGRTPELLAHPVYGPVVERHLRTASEICSDTLGQPIDLVERVKARRESTLDTFAEDIGLIFGVELAHIEIIRDQFGAQPETATTLLGFSLGEVACLVVGGVYSLEDVLVPLVALANDCASLAHDVAMGVLFSRGAALSLDKVEMLCMDINREGRGVISISSILSPNTVLLMGQGDTIERFKSSIPDVFGRNVQLRKNDNRWPPLHTPILWQKAVADRASVMMHRMKGGAVAPKPPVLSLVTGRASYTALNSRELLRRWLDQPQRLWDVVYELLSMGIETVIHIGPEPNLIPSTFKRLSDNVTAQVGNSTIRQWGLHAMQGIRRTWLKRLLSNRVALMRAPFVRHIVLEDWLLEQK